MLFISGLLYGTSSDSWGWRSQVEHSSHCVDAPTPTPTRTIQQLGVTTHPHVAITTQKMAVNVVMMVITTRMTTAPQSRGKITHNTSSGTTLMIIWISFTLSFSRICWIPLPGAARLFGITLYFCLVTLPTRSLHPKVLQWGTASRLIQLQGWHQDSFAPNEHLTVTMSHNNNYVTSTTSTIVRLCHLDNIDNCTTLDIRITPKQLAHDTTTNELYKLSTYTAKGTPLPSPPISLSLSLSILVSAVSYRTHVLMRYIWFPFWASARKTSI